MELFGYIDMEYTNLHVVLVELSRADMSSKRKVNKNCEYGLYYHGVHYHYITFHN